eukprot:2683886-Pyramimonas_sp.AAC.1
MYIRLPEEDATPGMVGQLLRTIYGTRDAANQRDSFFNDIITKLGYDGGHRNKLSIGWRHGDDLVLIGEADHTYSLFDEVGKHMILKKRGVLGFEDVDDAHITILNRLVDFCTKDGVPTVTFEPDPRHVDLLVDQLGLTGSR